MTQRYAHLAPSHRATSLARLSFSAPMPSEVASLDDEGRRRILSDEAIILAR